MASGGPKSSLNQNRRTISDADKMKMHESISNSHIPVDYQAVPLPASYLNSGPQVPPPLPPRSDLSRLNRLSNYNNYYNHPLSRLAALQNHTNTYYPHGIGNYRAPYTRYGISNDPYNSFIQLAEESTRPAFESIESVVGIVGSISMMLESTYHAVYSSYNAILGVVDQFARLKDHLAQVLSFLALLRGLRYLCLKVLYILRLRKDNPSVEAAWNTAKSVSENTDFPGLPEDRKSPWPFFMFIGLVIGAPWLMFKLLSKSVSKRSFDVKSWQGKEGYGLCVGNYNFKSTRRGELSFRAGEMLHVAPVYLQANVPRGWIVACNKNNEVGLIPQNYLKTKVPPKPSLSGAISSPVMQVTFPRSSDKVVNVEFDPFAFKEEISTTKKLDSTSNEDQVTNVDQKE